MENIERMRSAKKDEPETNKEEASTEAVNEKEYSKWEWFIYIILIPSIFTMIMVSIILSFFHINVLELAKGVALQIPYVQQFFQPKEESGKKLTPEEMLQQKLADSERKLGDATAALNQEKAKVTQLEQEIAVLKKQLDEAVKQAEDKKATEEERMKKAAEMARLLTGMNASKAAPILDQLSLQEAALILSQMRESDRATLLSKLDPKKSADLVALMNNTPYSSDLEKEALQKRIDQLVKELDDANRRLNALTAGGGGESAAMRSLVDTLKQMPPNSAAQMIKTMWINSDKEAVLNALTILDPQVRAAIFTELVNDQTTNGNGTAGTVAQGKTGKEIAAEINAALLKR